MGNVKYHTPLHKNGSASDLKNYRPISWPPKFSIVFEKMLFNFLYSIVRPLVTNAQQGFMKRRSTTTQLISYFDVLYNNLDKNFPCSSVYFHSFQAFVFISFLRFLIPFRIIVYKQKWQHLDLTKLFFIFLDYLEDQHQIDRIGSFFRLSVVKYGVPQGSVLGPLLFILYLSNLVDYVQNSHVYLYAENLKLLCVDCFDGVQCDINGIYEWSSKIKWKFSQKIVKQ